MIELMQVRLGLFGDRLPPKHVQSPCDRTWTTSWLLQLLVVGYSLYFYSSVTESLEMFNLNEII